MTNRMNPYLSQQILTANPKKLISMLYQLGLKSCVAKDKGKAAKVLVELMSALNFDHQPIALPLFDQYRYALDLVHHESFDYPTLMFKELKQLWDTAVMGQQAMAQI